MGSEPHSLTRYGPRKCPGLLIGNTKIALHAYPKFVNHISKYYRIRAQDDTIIDGWINVEEDDNWLRYYTIPGEFNTISMYKGSYFHSPHISDTLEDDEIRHILVFGYFSPTNEEEDGHYEREVEKWNYKKKT